MWYKKTALVLAAIGAINWGLTEIGWNAVQGILGWTGDFVVSIVYYLVAISGVYALFKAVK